MKSDGLDVIIVRFGPGPNYRDERFIVADRQWSLGKRPDEIESLTKGQP
jgi:hypothetical protein